MKKLIALCASLLVVVSSHATLLTIELDNTDYQIGDMMQANIVVSDIELKSNGIQKLVATFDFDLLFDESLLGYQSTSFGSLLNVDPFFFGDQSASLSGPGSLYVSEFTLAPDEDLFAAQGGLSSFVLASVNFEVLANGTNMFSLNNIELGDDFGGDFSQVSSVPTSITIGSVASVPETPTLAIFALGLLIFLARKLKA